MTEDLWQEKAACAGRFPLFDDRVHGESKSQREARHHRARTICRGCPVSNDCTAEAAANSYEGVWGGRLMEASRQGPKAWRASPAPLTVEQLKKRRMDREATRVECASCGARVMATGIRRHRRSMHGGAA